ncbi:MAG: VWA domain-containing protein [Chloroflexi bacterium]|nr:VWA domain-containing protein [Chloroflexota bacterium]MCI0579612.1 VWA domain-containing protein [Chloroflexota bacterium]MCI0644827.1 VWA domain-containing protein [Chloroflexota bacterium]MCI0731447.1 VWA domain-containing protein [Chloroflexota bacterium]
MKKRRVWLILFTLFLLTLALPAAAQEPEPPIVIPPQWNFEGLTIEYQRVDVTIEDQVATTHIDQLFVNDNDWVLEGVYLFPLPAGAAVSQLTMWVNGQPIEAKILEADEARQIYDEIVRQLRDPALLEYIGSSAIQANVFPIPPHDERRIEIEYSQVLPAEGGLIHYVYPQSTELYTNTPLDNQSIRVEVVSDEEIRAIYSPSHQVAIDRDGDFRAVAGYEAASVQADTDFELYYSVSPEAIGLSLLSYKEPDEDGFFLLLVAPTVEVDPNQVVAKDVILVIDTSGSMHGEKMDQAKEAALFVVDNLNPQDRFNVIDFSTGVRRYAEELVPAEAPGNYQSFINSLEAIGGTNISQALLEGVVLADSERPTTILFLTDGLATEGITDSAMLLDAVEQQTPDNVRIFAFGVGDDVDTFLLDSLVQNHGGTSTYVRPGQQIDEAVSGFYAKVSTPVLANISLDFGDIIAEQQYPQTLPDLFAGTQLVLTGRYREGGPATITLTGEVNGEEQTFVYEDNFFRSSGGDDFIPRLWATRAIGHLLTQIRLQGENPELVQSVVNLSIRYGIITPYTSYLIEEDDIFTQSGQQIIIEEAGEAFGLPAEVSGGVAVDRAADEGELAAAEAPLAAAPETTVVTSNGQAVAVNEVVRLVGNKTFVLRDGIWMDTAYNADTMTPQQVGFASDAYFELLSAAPELGQYLALGQRVLVVYEGQAYLVVEGEGQETVTLPEIRPTEVVPTGNNQGQPPQEGPSGNGNEPGNANEPSSGLCASAMVMPLLAFGLVIIAGRRRPFKA